jgi:hypothetical protein
MSSHPDLYPHTHTRAQLRMVRLNIAASVLLKPERRAEYDLGRRLMARRRWRASQRRRQEGSDWYPWPATTAGRGCAAYDWTQASRSPRAARQDREVATVLDLLRHWPSRMLQALFWETSTWSPRQHALFTLTTVGLAFLLITAARPRSLPMFQHDAKTAQHHVEAAQSG